MAIVNLVLSLFLCLILPVKLVNRGREDYLLKNVTLSINGLFAGCLGITWAIAFQYDGMFNSARARMPSKKHVVWRGGQAI